MSDNHAHHPEILWSVPSPTYEQDCACSTDADIILPSEYLDSIFSDCACSSDCNQPVLDKSLYSNLQNLWQKSPFLYRQTLDSTNDLLFNPVGPGGPVVLNHAAQKILDAFVNPNTIQSGVASVHDVQVEKTTSIVQHMIMLGLLSSSSYTKPLNQTPKTLTAWLHVTNQCNLRCDYCYITKTPDKMEIEHGKQSVDAVFRSALANGFQSVKLKFAGGESTLNFPLILELHDYAQLVAKENGLGVTGVVLSNGVGITDRMINSLQERRLRLSISLDGIGEFHDAQRKFINGKGSFHLVERSLDRLSVSGVNPSITITVSNRNLDGLPQVVDFVLQRNLPFTINFYRENECSSGHIDLAYNDEKIIEAMKKAFSIIENNLPPHSLLGSLVDRARLDTPHNKPCGVGDSYLVIDQNGKVAKCHMEIERSITDISMPDPLKLIQLDQIGIQNVSVDEKEGCRDCAWRYWCAGGCPALTYRVTGRYDIKSPNCHIYKALFPEVLRLEGLRLLKYSKSLSM
ncbi:MAG: radical SAM protein [Chloroflexota bacterium]